MPLNSSVSALVSNRKTGVSIGLQTANLQRTDPTKFQAFNTLGNAINDIYNQLTQTPTVEELTVVDANGNVLAQIGDFDINGVSYSGAAFSDVWIGPGANPSTAPFFSDGTHVVIGQNGQVLVRDTGGNTVATLGVSQDSPKSISAATNASPVVITIASHGYVNGDTVQIAGATGNTAINGYRIVENVTTNTFTMTDLSGSPINGNGAYSGAATATRYYAGILAETFAIGPSFANYKLRAFADGSLAISNATISLVNGSNSIVLDPSVPDIVVTGSSLTITLDGSNGLKIVGSSLTTTLASLTDPISGLHTSLYSLNGSNQYAMVAPTTFTFGNTVSGPFGNVGLDSGSKPILNLVNTSPITDFAAIQWVGGLGAKPQVTFNGSKVLTVRQTTPTKTTRTAGTTYTSNEQNMLNDLKAWQNGVDTALNNSGHGLWT